MTDAEARESVIRYWVEKASRALDSARAEDAAGRYDFAVNRAYYACFYVVSALLLKEGHRFTKHSAVRAILHQHYVKTDKLPAEWGRFYDRIFENRQRSDYLELVEFETEQVAELVRLAADFVREVQALLQA